MYCLTCKWFHEKAGVTYCYSRPPFGDERPLTAKDDPACGEYSCRFNFEDSVENETIQETHITHSEEVFNG